MVFMTVAMTVVVVRELLLGRDTGGLSSFSKATCAALLFFPRPGCPRNVKSILGSVRCKGEVAVNCVAPTTLVALRTQHQARVVSFDVQRALTWLLAGKTATQTLSRLFLAHKLVFYFLKNTVHVVQRVVLFRAIEGSLLLRASALILSSMPVFRNKGALPPFLLLKVTQFVEVSSVGGVSIVNAKLDVLSVRSAVPNSFLKVVLRGVNIAASILLQASFAFELRKLLRTVKSFAEGFRGKLLRFTSYAVRSGSALWLILFVSAFCSGTLARKVVVLWVDCFLIFNLILFEWLLLLL